MLSRGRDMSALRYLALNLHSASAFDRSSSSLDAMISSEPKRPQTLRLVLVYALFGASPVVPAVWLARLLRRTARSESRRNYPIADARGERPSTRTTASSFAVSASAAV